MLKIGLLSWKKLKKLKIKRQLKCNKKIKKVMYMLLKKKIKLFIKKKQQRIKLFINIKI